jgi:hypothetical protein
VVGDVSKYNAVGILGNPNVQPSSPLSLDGNAASLATPDSVSWNYQACPAKTLVNSFSSDDTNATELTLVPCSEDFENQIPSNVTVQFLVTNEFEERFSASTTVTCRLSIDLTKIDSQTAPDSSVFSRNVLGTDVSQTEITPVPNNGGVVGIAERRTTWGGGAARAAYNLTTQGDLIPANGPDVIRLTAGE